VNQCRANILRQRQSFLAVAFAVYNELASLPVEIIQGHRNHFAGAQTEPGQKQQDREVALACQVLRSQQVSRRST
jgi:hypothetical protein